MATKIDGQKVELEGSDWAVEFEEWVYEAQSQGDARRTRRLAGGKVVTRDVYVTDWREVK